MYVHGGVRLCLIHIGQGAQCSAMITHNADHARANSSSSPLLFTNSAKISSVICHSPPVLWYNSVRMGTRTNPKPEA